MHRKHPDPVVLPSPHSRRCDAPQDDLRPPAGQSADSEATANMNDEYALEMGLAGALK